MLWGYVYRSPFERGCKTLCLFEVYNVQAKTRLICSP
nr:MAG TPA: hypothetical protein [Caudoviricetes sp.]